MNQIQAVVLAGGIGRRMRPITTGKNLIPFLGRPIIDYTLTDLVEAGVRRILVVVNKANCQPIDDLARKKKAEVATVVQAQAKGMADALKVARPKLKPGPVLVVNATDLYSPGFYQEFLSALRRERVTLTGFKTEEYLPGGYFKLKAGRVNGLVEKPGPENRPSYFFKSAVDYFPQAESLYTYLAKAESSKDDLYEVALDEMIKKERVAIFKYQGRYQQLKYPWHILKMMEQIFTQRLERAVSPEAEIADQAIVNGPVVVEPEAKIMAGAVINGPSYIGRGTVVGTNCLVRSTCLGRGCLVGCGTELARCWVGSRSFFHRNYIGDSVIEGGVNFGAGASIANFRLDGQPVDFKPVNSQRKGEKMSTGCIKMGAVIGRQVKVGINSSIMPGILVGQKTFIGPGLVLNQSLGEERQVYRKEELMVKTKVKRSD